MGKFETANALAILAGARVPSWTEQAAWTTPPQSASAGVYLENSLFTMLAVEMREEVHRRTARVTISTLDLAASYTVTINGTACTAAGPFANLPAIINGLVTAINASAIASAVTASAVDEDASIAGVETVKIVGDNSTDYTITMSATGTGVLAVVADPTIATLKIYAKLRGSSAPSAWVAPYDASYALDWTGYVERLACAGVDRFAAELSDVDGTGDGASVTYTNVTVKIGPCVAE